LIRVGRHRGRISRGVGRRLDGGLIRVEQLGGDGGRQIVGIHDALLDVVGDVGGRDLVIEVGELLLQLSDPVASAFWKAWMLATPPVSVVCRVAMSCLTCCCVAMVSLSCRSRRLRMWTCNETMVWQRSISVSRSR
jgi:hypothetical protein